MSSENYYNILNVSKNASIEEIKSSYRKLALQNHPDKNPGDPDAEQRFKKIGEAYEVLSDTEKRQQYDSMGTVRLENNSFNHFNDIFNMINKGIFNTFNKGNRAGTISVSLSQAYNGCSIRSTVQRTNKCSICEGSGYHDKINHDCVVCNGNGYIVEDTLFMGMFKQQLRHQCPSCKGIKSTELKCYSCKGNKIQEETFLFDLPIPKGMNNNTSITLYGIGNIVDYKNMARDDVTVNVSINDSDSDIKLKDNCNLKTNMEISLKEALCGFKKYIKHLDGRNVCVEGDNFIQKKEVQILGEGLKNGYLEVNITVKNEHTKEQMRRAFDYIESK